MDWLGVVFMAAPKNVIVELSDEVEYDIHP
jgi:hypothetical protein